MLKVFTKSTVNLKHPILSFNKARFNTNTKKALLNTAKDFKSDVLSNMRQSEPTGKWYTLPLAAGSSVLYRASRKGQPPAIRTGNLYNSIQIGKVSHKTSEVFSTAPYAATLEHDMKRPYFTSLIKDNTLLTRFLNSVKKYLKIA